MSDPRYPDHELLVAPARTRPELWRLVVGLFVIFVIVLLLNGALRAGLQTLAPDFWRNEFSDPAGQGGTPGSMLVLLGSFGFVTAAVLITLGLVQKRSPLQVLGPLPLALRQFWIVLRALLVLGFVLLVLPPYSMDQQPLTPNLAPGLWAILLPFSLLGVLLQTSAEEILFRGYIQQQLAARYKSRFVWIGVPSVLFAMGHYLPGAAGDNALVIAVWSGLFGVLAADLTARAGTLGPAIALHLANNAAALLLVSLPDSLNGLSLYTVPYSMSDADAIRAWLPVEFGAMIVSWLTARLALRR